MIAGAEAEPMLPPSDARYQPPLVRGRHPTIRWFSDKRPDLAGAVWIHVRPADHPTTR